MKKYLLLSFTLLASISCFSQQAYYGVTAGNGYGLRFWNDDAYKIHMGSGSEYSYGPVTNYSIKMNMDGYAGRGWVWGANGATPVAGLSNTGHMQIAGNFAAGGDLRAGSGSINSNTNYLALMAGVGADDNSYEWTGFYSGTTRQGIILYDGAWSGANNLPNEFSISAENANKLTLNTQGTDIALMPKGGNVGIGTTSPGYKLQVAGGAIALDTDQPLRGGNKWLISGNSNEVTVGTADAGVNLTFDAGASDRMLINGTTGNVGIGTTTPDSKLTVKGVIHSQEVKVDLNGSVAPDYVFEKDYPLTSLEELKSYIDQNKHLPEIPSAKEMEEEGMNLKEMNLLLLKKVEELTLHLLNQENEIKSLKQTVNILSSKIDH